MAERAPKLFIGGLSQYDHADHVAATGHDHPPGRAEERLQAVRMSGRAGLPDHDWQGTDDGHNCTGCDNTSVWRCDRPAHDRNAVLPPLPKNGMELNDPMDLLDPAERQKLHDDLEHMARQRRLAGPDGRQMA